MQKNTFNNSKLMVIILITTLLIITGCSSKYESTEVGKLGRYASSQISEGKMINSDSANNENKLTAKDEIVAITASTKSNEGLNTLLDKSPDNKIIINGHIEMECLNYEETLSKLQKFAAENKGYISSSEIQGASIKNSGNYKTRVANLTLRIPKGSYNNFTDGLKQFGQITLQRVSTQDISTEYFDTDARVTSLKTQEQRLLDLFKKADKMADIIVIEDKLRDVRHQIESLTGNLKRWDNLVEYSTLNIILKEVGRYQDIQIKSESLFSRMYSNLKSSILSLKDFGEDLLLASAYLLPFVIIIVILFLIILPLKRYLRKHSKKLSTLSDESSAIQEDKKADCVVNDK